MCVNVCIPNAHLIGINAGKTGSRLVVVCSTEFFHLMTKISVVTTSRRRLKVCQKTSLQVCAAAVALLSCAILNVVTVYF